MHQNIKFIKFLCVHRQRQLLSTPSQPMLSFNIVPYGTKFSNAKSFTINLIQSKEWPFTEEFSKILTQRKHVISHKVQVNQNVIKVIVNTIFN